MAKSQNELLGTTMGTARNGKPAPVYEIIAGEDGRVYCTCIGWKMRKTCKHLKAFARKHPAVAKAYGMPEGRA